MRIAVVDVAAESGGAVSVLKDFLQFAASDDADTNEYFVFASRDVGVVHPRIHCILKPDVKRSWAQRLRWELLEAVRELAELKIDIVFSLQNTAFFSRKLRQVVYFHNALLLEAGGRYSLFKEDERLLGIYTRAVAPYTMKSLRYADAVICQTNTIKAGIEKRVPGIRAVTISPDVRIDERFVDSASAPLRGFIYPAAPVPFKQIEEVIRCAGNNREWFAANDLELLITVSGSENAYAGKVVRIGAGIPHVKFIGYRQRDEILALYKDHALIINSEQEAYPLPFREAELVGAPIIAADYPYAVEILDGSGKAGLYRKHDLSDMFSKMQWALSAAGSDGKAAAVQRDPWAEVREIITQIT